jgi:hypothetical protein
MVKLYGCGLHLQNSRITEGELGLVERRDA